MSDILIGILLIISITFVIYIKFKNKKRQCEKCIKKYYCNKDK